MAKGAATEGSLGVLHEKVAKVMARALDQVDKAQEVYDQALELAADDLELKAQLTRPEVSPTLLGVVTKFLNDNKITCIPEESAQMSELEQKLKDKQRKRVGNVVHLIDE